MHSLYQWLGSMLLELTLSQGHEPLTCDQGDGTSPASLITPDGLPAQYGQPARLAEVFQTCEQHNACLIPNQVAGSVSVTTTHRTNWPRQREAHDSSKVPFWHQGASRTESARFSGAQPGDVRTPNRVIHLTLNLLLHGSRQDLWQSYREEAAMSWTLGSV